MENSKAVEECVDQAQKGQGQGEKGLEAGAQGQFKPPLALHSQLSPTGKVQVAVLCFLLLHVKPQALLCDTCVLVVHTHCASLPVLSAGGNPYSFSE